MKVDIQQVTPEMAAEWLLLNTANRPMSWHIVKKYADDMRQGRWKTNGDSIRFSGSRLLDGQKRLQAIVDSGVTVSFLIVDDLADDVFDTLDRGQGRSAADTLAVIGEKNYATLAASLLIVERYYTSQMTVSQKSVPNWRIVELLAKYPDLRSSVNHLCATKLNSLVRPSLGAAMHYVFARFDRELADVYMKDLRNGTNLQPGDSVLMLRERLINNLSAKAKLSSDYIAALIVKAWNYRRDGHLVKCLKWSESGNNTEPFPIAH